MKTLLIAAAFILALSLPIAAQDMHMDHTQTPAGAESAATSAYKAANMAMHSAMDIDYSGDPDIDFLRGMIAHHRGAIAMARIELDHGQAPEVKTLAQGIIAAQESEIAWMQDWLAQHPAP